ncbi:MAG: histidine--tRNA ligase [Candidatus Yonathbacteria bacterium]|nr:histidine--tRNA ligase [Candidatus Yonathbacteria bacterium]NTW47398.1 histidine--tRNA ligase [Candidatus Yonathbacteria bacterium]
MSATPAKKSSKELRTPKGMHDIIGEDFYAYQGLFEKIQEVAVYYGFSPIQTPILEDEDVFARGVGEHTDIVEKEMYGLRTKGGDKLVMRPEGTAAVMRAYMEHGMQSLPQPVMLYNYGEFFRHENPQKGRLREFRQFNFEILGSEKSIADAIVIRTVVDALEEVGFADLCVEINSIGDIDSRVAYTRALVNYYKKHTDSLCPHCKERLKTNPLRLLDCKDARCQEFKEEAPESLNHLSAPAKKHFKEVLEYLDSSGITYRIDNTLVRGLDYYSHTVFEIKALCPAEGSEEATSLTIAGGGRYDGLGKLLGSKKPIPAVGAAIGIDRLITTEGVKIPSPRILKKPKVYFIQLGFEARLKSLSVIEMLRKAHVPIAQSLSKDGLGAQLGTAEKMGIPYAIIFGQQEAMDGTVIVRNMESRSQDTVKLAELPSYLKGIK